MIDPDHPRLSIVRQCEVENGETLRLMRLIDEQFLETPWYGSRQMTFDEDVVHPAATPIHRDADVGLLVDVGEGKAGELRALIRVEDIRLAEAGDRLLQRCNAEVGIIVFESLHARTFRLNQSMIATR